MRLQEKNKRDATLRPKIGGTDVPIWGAGTTIRAVIQPAQSKLMAEIYGERIKRMKLMLYDGHVAIAEGTGVCVDVLGDQPCDYQVVSAGCWAGHQNITLEWIPEGRRA